MLNTAVDDYRYPPSAARARQDQPQLGESNFSDGSGALFSMYLNMAEEEDNKMTESWKGDADGMLVFARLHLTFHPSANNVEM